MSAPNFITVAGNLTADPEVRRTSAEIPFTKLRVAVSRRILTAETGVWEDRHDGYFSVTCWRDMARYAGLSLRKGDRVVITGRLTRRQFEARTADGGSESRHVVEIEADEIGASLRWNAWSRLQARPIPVDVAAETPDQTPDEPADDAADESSDGPDVTVAA